MPVGKSSAQFIPLLFEHSRASAHLYRKTLMAITTPINLHGQQFIKQPADVGPAPGMKNVPGSSTISYRNVARPRDIPAAASRLTFAVDVCAVNGYTSGNGNHIVVAARVNPDDPADLQGGSGWQGIIMGGLNIPVTGFPAPVPGQQQPARVTAEERRLSGNLHQWGTGANAVQEHKWYRYVVDSIRYQGARLYECRVYAVADELSNTLGLLLYKSPTITSPEAGLAYTESVMFANVAGTTNGLIVGRIAAHWSHATEWVANP